MVVDDNAPFGAALARLLTRMGHHVHTFTSGQEALDHLQRSGVYADAVITDQHMPGITGMELGHTLAHTHPELVIVMLSSLATLITDEQLMAHNISHALNKPCSQDELRDVLQHIRVMRQH